MFSTKSLYKHRLYCLLAQLHIEFRPCVLSSGGASFYDPLNDLGSLYVMTKKNKPRIFY